MTGQAPGMTEVAESRAKQLISSIENLPEEERKRTLAQMFKELVDGGSFTLFDLFLRARIRAATDQLVRAHSEELCAAQATVITLVALQRDLFVGEAEESIKQAFSYLQVSPFNIIDRSSEQGVPFARR